MEDIRVNSNILAVLSFNPPLGFAATAVIAIILISFPTFLLAYNRRARKNDQNITDATLTSDIRRVAIAACLTVMFFMPCIVSTATLQAVSATDVFIAVDVTGSMGVKDAQYGSSEKISRIAAAKKAIEDIVNLHADASFSAIRASIWVVFLSNTRPISICSSIGGTGTLICPSCSSVNECRRFLDKCSNSLVLSIMR